MEKYFQKILKTGESSRSPLERDDAPNQRRVEVELNNLEKDLGLRKQIRSYHPNDQENVRRSYLLHGPSQPNLVSFPFSDFGGKPRRFIRSWYNEFEDWLEYSKAKDVAYFLFFYLFKPDIGDQSGGDTFASVGFKNWKKKSSLNEHAKSDAHYKAWKMSQDLLNQSHHIETAIHRQSRQVTEEYRLRLNASIETIRFLLKQGLPFRGHDESEDSDNRGNFLELLELLANFNDNVASVVLKNAPENLKLTSPTIQKDIVNAAAMETLNSIIKSIGDEPFAILVDESRDISVKEQMAVALRYVNVKGEVLESFIGLEHVTSTTASSLKKAIDSLFSKHKLSISRLRGQGYDGASNMRGEFAGLKTRILEQNGSAYYVHCFAHQLQLALVGVAKKNYDVNWFFNLVSGLLNVVGGSCKSHDTLLELQAAKVYEALDAGELESGRGLNQECNLARASDTRWSSHYETLASLIKMFPAVIGVLEKIRDDGDENLTGGAQGLLINILKFDFVFNLHLMKKILAITNELSKALQRKDQDIINAIDLVKVSKKRLQDMRDVGFDPLLDEVKSFCATYDIDVPNMSELFQTRPKRKGSDITNEHRYKCGLFNEVLDFQLQELRERFTEATTELLVCMACLNPVDSFSTFDKQKVIRLASFYPKDFSEKDYTYLEDQLDTYIYDVRTSNDFLELKGLGDLAKKMVQTKKHLAFGLVYRLLKLTLVLPVATATVERAFSAMKIVKNRLRSRMGDQFLNDSLLVYIEKKRFNEVTNDAIMKRFQDMKPRRGHL